MKTFDTAAIYYHKFRVRFPSNEYNYEDVALAALFVACKAEDTIKKSKEILCAAHNLRQPHDHKTPDDKVSAQRPHPQGSSLALASQHVLTPVQRPSRPRLGSPSDWSATSSRPSASTSGSSIPRSSSSRWPGRCFHGRTRQAGKRPTSSFASHTTCRSTCTRPSRPSSRLSLPWCSPSSS